MSDMWNASFNRYDQEPDDDPPEESWNHCNDCGKDSCSNFPRLAYQCFYCGSTNISPVQVELDDADAAQDFHADQFAASADQNWVEP